MAPHAQAPIGLRRRGRSGWRRCLATVTSAVLAVVGLSVATPGFTGPGSRVASGGREASATARSAAERAAYIAVVDVNVTEGGEEAFLAASLQNARESVREEDNCRFDILQSQENPRHFTLVEIYGSADGPVGHKDTQHYLGWREAVANLMASPRQASQWDTVFPSDSSGYVPDVIFLERDEFVYLDITHVFSTVKTGQEEDFIKATVRCIKDTLNVEEGNLRYDLLRNVDDPSKFLIVQVFRKPESTSGHQRTDHFARWRDNVASMMAEPRTFKKYVNHFPNVPAGWKVDPGVN